MRTQSARRAPQASRNSCREPPVGMASPTLILLKSLRHSAAYLREMLDQFGNLGLAAAAYNAGPGRISAWLTRRPISMNPIMEREICWWIPRLQLGERGAVSWQDGGERSSWR